MDTRDIYKQLLKINWENRSEISKEFLSLEDNFEAYINEIKDDCIKLRRNLQFKEIQEAYKMFYSDYTNYLFSFSDPNKFLLAAIRPDVQLYESAMYFVGCILELNETLPKRIFPRIKTDKIIRNISGLLLAHGLVQTTNP